MASDGETDEHDDRYERALGTSLPRSPAPDRRLALAAIALVELTDAMAAAILLLGDMSGLSAIIN